MKKAVIVAGLLIAVSVGMAGEHPTPQQRADKQTEKLTKQLGLSEEQAEEVNAIALEAANKIQPLQEQRKALKTEIKAIQADKKEQIKEVLTPEQLAEYEEILAKKEAKKKEKRAARKAN